MEDIFRLRLSVLQGSPHPILVSRIELASSFVTGCFPLFYPTLRSSTNLLMLLRFITYPFYASAIPGSMLQNLSLIPKPEEPEKKKPGRTKKSI